MNVVVNENGVDLQQAPFEYKLLQQHPIVNALSALGYDESQPPIASLLAQHMGLEGDWVILSPVRWEATHNNAYIHQVGCGLYLSEPDLKRSFNAYSEFLAEEGLTLKYFDELLWLLKLNHQAPPKSKTVYEVLGHPLMFELQKMGDTQYWQKLITESQMFFATLPTQKGLNGVWVWGGGHAFQPKQIRVFADLSWHTLALCLSPKVTLIDKNSDLKACELLLLKNDSELSEAQLKQLRKQYVRWSWNDCQYTTRPLSWFHRLWSVFIHAN